MGQARAGALLPGGETHGGSTGLLAILKSSPDRPGGKRGWACASNLKDSHAAPPQWPCWVPSRPHLNRLAYDSRGRFSGAQWIVWAVRDAGGQVSASECAVIQIQGPRLI